MAVCCREKGGWALMDEAIALDELDWWTRCRFHPCTKPHVAMCRGRVGFYGAWDSGGFCAVAWWAGRNVKGREPCS